MDKRIILVKCLHVLYTSSFNIPVLQAIKHMIIFSNNNLVVVLLLPVAMFIIWSQTRVSIMFSGSMRDLGLTVVSHQTIVSVNE